MNKFKSAFWIVTGLLSLMMLASAAGYLFNTAELVSVFETLGHPGHIVIPLAIAKILAVIAITTRKNNTLKEWAYAGLFFEFVIAFMAHISIPDKDWLGAIIALSLLFASYFLQVKAFPKNNSI